MTEDVPDLLSIPEKILQTLFTSLKGQEGFDQSIISQLQALAKKEQPADVESITAVLKNDEGDDNAPH